MRYVHLCVSGAQEDEDITFPGSGIRDDCDLPCGWDLNLSPLQKRQVSHQQSRFLATALIRTSEDLDVFSARQFFSGFEFPDIPIFQWRK